MQQFVSFTFMSFMLCNKGLHLLSQKKLFCLFIAVTFQFWNRILIIYSCQFFFLCFLAQFRFINCCLICMTLQFCMILLFQFVYACVCLCNWRLTGIYYFFVYFLSITCRILHQVFYFILIFFPCMHDDFPFCLFGMQPEPMYQKSSCNLRKARRLTFCFRSRQPKTSARYKIHSNYR